MQVRSDDRRTYHWAGWLSRLCRACSQSGCMISRYSGPRPARVGILSRGSAGKKKTADRVDYDNTNMGRRPARTFRSSGFAVFRAVVRPLALEFVGFALLTALGIELSRAQQVFSLLSALRPMPICRLPRPDVAPVLTREVDLGTENGPKNRWSRTIGGKHGRVWFKRPRRKRGIPPPERVDFSSNEFMR